jgi:hypothetical protein
VRGEAAACAHSGVLTAEAGLVGGFALQAHTDFAKSHGSSDVCEVWGLMCDAARRCCAVAMHAAMMCVHLCDVWRVCWVNMTWEDEVHAGCRTQRSCRKERGGAVHGSMRGLEETLDART